MKMVMVATASFFVSSMAADVCTFSQLLTVTFCNHLGGIRKLEHYTFRNLVSGFQEAIVKYWLEKDLDF